MDTQKFERRQLGDPIYDRRPHRQTLMSDRATRQEQRLQVVHVDET